MEEDVVLAEKSFSPNPEQAFTVAEGSNLGISEEISKKEQFIAKTIEEMTKVRSSLGLDTTEADVGPSIARAKKELAELQLKRGATTISEPLEDVGPQGVVDIEAPVVDVTTPDAIQKIIEEIAPSEEALNPVSVENFSSEPESLETIESPYELLKGEVISGEASIEQVRDKLIELAPEDSLAFLQDEEVSKTLLENPVTKDRYNQLMSLVQFQCAEFYALRESPRALGFLEDALKTSRAFSKPAWSAYIQGTILYLSGKQIPEALINTVGEKNRIILTKFNQGLMQRGAPRYTQDYPSAILSS